jgi:uncharacterized 2Fe-2S/4Fe-4S cluster protein (DUF4445 family)
MKELKLTFPEYSKSIYALPGTDIFECISRAGILIRTPCGGKGTCGKCAIQVIEGTLTPSRSCEKFFSENELAQGWRLACKTKITEEISIIIPSATLYESDTVAVTSNTHKSGKGLKNKVGTCDVQEHVITRKLIKLKEPSLEEPVADLENLFSVLGERHIPFSELIKLPSLLRENEFELSVVSCDANIIALESPTETACYALAFDIGTTTLAVALLDLNSNQVIATQGILNPQVKYGGDILSRIAVQSESIENRSEMSNVIIQACNELVKTLTDEHNISSENIYGAVFAGNSVMQMLFCGIPVKALGEIPFTPPFVRNMSFSANDLKLNIKSTAELVFMPLLGGFVGGDITAGIIATELVEDKNAEVILFVDVGTNGEIVLKKGNKLYSAAAAAGPAFEGAGITNGMRAGKGAIEKVVIKDDKVLYNIIGNIEPKGICGTALIDVVAEMLRHKLLDETGRIKAKNELDQDSEQYAEHLSEDNNAPSFNITIDREKPILINQKDIRNLQLASGAIRATTNILLNKAGVTADSIDKLYIAGGFGNFIRQANAKRIGLIPNIPDEKIFFIGNSSLLGAEMAMFCKNKFEAAVKIALQVEVVDVSLDLEFQMEFANAMIFPSL